MITIIGYDYSGWYILLFFTYRKLERHQSLLFQRRCASHSLHDMQVPITYHSLGRIHLGDWTLYLSWPIPDTVQNKPWTLVSTLFVLVCVVPFSWYGLEWKYCSNFRLVILDCLLPCMCMSPGATFWLSLHSHIRLCAICMFRTWKSELLQQLTRPNQRGDLFYFRSSECDPIPFVISDKAYKFWLH